ncbi:anaerobically induced outer membrane protein [Alteromonas sp. KUL154]|uniref:copper-containing nitrite reductase n=1 Tax=Tenacibaculum sp. XPcli2-G TaxID=2954503 RepID=UPI0012E69F1B|nr:copper-containing nitrite reductase [Tenacibaculum sp. XPcli2-G]MCO7185744.1 copper-containing nitrite reductase [Tenacibaculum sp. XPcli2-G]GFD93104.1 anaerobically induced outer membrane protein [Alteromonas sp. KUL154]
MKQVKTISMVLAAMFLMASCKNEKSESIAMKSASDIAVKGTIEAELTAPPYVPAPVGNRSAKKLLVNMEILEKEGTMTDGVEYVYWTFGGSVPGSFIRTRVGDEVEFTLSNHPDNRLPHNIDLHAVTGPGGGATSSFVAPGHEKTFSFKTLNPGLYVYHCATAPVGMHIANGMYGLILVEPEGGLPKVDKEYYIMQGDFYTKGENGEPGLQPFDMRKAVDEDADYVVFNGSVGALTGDNAITANVGETVRLFVGNGGPNLTSSFHVIGEIFDNVHVEGGSVINKDVQTTSIPAGGAAIVDFKVDVPGTFILVDHAIFRAFNKGALGMLKVKGEESKKIYSGVKQEGIYNPEGGTIQEMPNGKEDKAVASKQEKSLAQKIADGKQIYTKTCFACHQANGEGIPNAFPPLAKSDYLNADVKRAIDIILHGKTGEITVNGQKYNSVMTKQALNDQEVADVLTYVYNSWGNNKTNVSVNTVMEVKSTH